MSDPDREKIVNGVDRLIGSNNLLWRSGQVFDSKVETAINEILDSKSQTSEHPSFRQGFKWRLGPLRRSTIVELFPEVKLARFQLVGTESWPPVRQYHIDGIYSSATSTEKVISVLSIYERRRSVISFDHDGMLAEHHSIVKVGERIVSNDSTLSINVTSMLTVKEAANVIGCHPTNIAYLIRTGKLTAVRRGPQWFLDPSDVEQYQMKSNKGRRKDSGTSSE